MTKCYLDSNVLMYFQNNAYKEHAATKEIVRNLRKNSVPVYISSLSLDEFIHSFRLELILGKEKQITEKLRDSLHRILELPTLSIINPPTNKESHLDIITLMETYSLRPRDAYHLLTMQANGVDGFATFDNDFAKVFRAKLLQKAQVIPPWT